MNKLLKLTGVSVLAIMATANANAAGYTCEELIEYTSCNTGYALLDGDCVCDGGYYTNGDKCTVCPIGTYSSVNASECTTCPTTGLVDPDNKAIVATTASTGSKNISACIIPTNVTIKGTTGLYHFKSSCAYDDTFDVANATDAEKQARCEKLGGNWTANSENHLYCEPQSDWFANFTEEKCSAHADCEYNYDEGACYCDCPYTFVQDLNTGTVDCMSGDGF